MKHVADTSALYALLNGTDPHHEAARERFDQIETIEVPASILSETIDLVAYRHTDSMAREAITALLELPNLRIAEPVHIEAVARLYTKAKGDLSLADAFVVQTCRSLAAPPFTFDEGIEQWAKNHIS